MKKRLSVNDDFALFSIWEKNKKMNGFNAAKFRSGNIIVKMRWFVSSLSS